MQLSDIESGVKCELNLLVKYILKSLMKVTIIICDFIDYYRLTTFLKLGNETIKNFPTAKDIDKTNYYCHVLIWQVQRKYNCGQHLLIWQAHKIRISIFQKFSKG